MVTFRRLPTSAVLRETVVMEMTLGMNLLYLIQIAVLLEIFMMGLKL